MNLYLLALFLHIAAVVAAFSATSILHHGLIRLYRADSAREARAAAMQTAKTGMRMPLYALALFLTGSWLVIQQWRWSASWVDAGILGLVIMVAMGGAVLKPRIGPIMAALGQADGPVPEPAAKLLTRTLWRLALVPPLIALGVMFDMVMKPEFGWALAFVAIAIVIGIMLPMPRAKAA